MKIKIKQFFCKHKSTYWDLIKNDEIIDIYNVYCITCNKLIYKNTPQINYIEYIKSFGIPWGRSIKIVN